MSARTRHAPLLAGLVLAAPLVWPAAGSAAEKPPIEIVNEEAANKDVFKFDFGVPSSPALTLLGIDKDKVTQSNSLKPFVLTLPDLLTSKESGQAAALDFSPAWLLYSPAQRTYGEYAKDPGRARLFRTRLAVAIYEGVDDADVKKQKPSRAALGFSTSWLNSSDPLLAPTPGSDRSAWLTCLTGAADDIRAALEDVPELPGEAELEARVLALGDEIAALGRAMAVDGLDPATRASMKALLEGKTDQFNKADAELTKLRTEGQAKQRERFAKTEAAKLVPTCMEVADLSARLGADLDFGGGAVWAGAPGEFSDFEDPTAVIWASFRRSFGVDGPEGDSFAALKAWHKAMDHWYMAGVSARVGFDESVATGDAARPKIRANTYSAWLGVERYTKDSRLALQIGQEMTDPKAGADSAFEGTRGRYLVGYDRRLGDTGLWVNVSYGEAEGVGFLKDDKTVRVAFSFSEPAARKILGAP